MKDDTISRAAALDFVSAMNFCDEISDEAYQKLTVHLENLSSAQPSATDTNVATTDTISRAAVVDAIEGVDWYHQNDSGDMVHGANSEEHQAWYKAEDIYKAIKGVPPAQPGQRNARVFQGIIVEYPSISAYPEYEGKPYFSIKYTENGQEFIGYGTYKPEVLSEYLKEYFMPPTQPGWIPCSYVLPGKSAAYLVTIKWEEDEYDIECLEYNDYSKEWNDGDLCGWRVIAWMPLPEPWEGGRNA